MNALLPLKRRKRYGRVTPERVPVCDSVANPLGPLMNLLPGAFSGQVNSPFPVCSFDIAMQLAELRLALNNEPLHAVRFHADAPLAFMDNSAEDLLEPATRVAIELDFRTSKRRFKLRPHCFDARHEKRHMRMFMGRFAQPTESFIDLAYLLQLLDAVQLTPGIRRELNAGAVSVPYAIAADAGTRSYAVCAFACMRRALRTWLPVGSVQVAQTPTRVRASLHSPLIKFEFDAKLGTATRLLVRRQTLCSALAPRLTVVSGVVEAIDAERVLSYAQSLVKRSRRAGPWLAFSFRAVRGEADSYGA